MSILSAVLRTTEDFSGVIKLLLFLLISLSLFIIFLLSFKCHPTLFFFLILCSGDKRLTFVQLEALTGWSAKDEWDFQFLGMSNHPFIKAVRGRTTKSRHCFMHLTFPFHYVWQYNTALILKFNMFSASYRITLIMKVSSNDFVTPHFSPSPRWTTPTVRNYNLAPIIKKSYSETTNNFFYSL